MANDNDDALIQAQFQVPASEVQAGVNGRLLLTATLQAASSETILQTEEIKNIIEGINNEVNTTVNNFSANIGSRVGYKFRVNNISDSSYTPVMEDEGTLVRMLSNEANTVIIPPSSQTNFDDGTVINIRQAGNGQTSVQAGTGVTITGPFDQFTTDGKGFGVAVVKVGADEWDFIKSFKAVPIEQVTDFVDQIGDFFNDFNTRLDNLSTDVGNAAVQDDNLADSITQTRNDLNGDLVLLGERVDARRDKDQEQDGRLDTLESDLSNTLGESAFDNRLFSEGQQKLPGGLVLKWGQATIPFDQEQDVTFFEAFPNECLQVLISTDFQSGDPQQESAMFLVSFDRAKFTARNDRLAESGGNRLNAVGRFLAIGW